MKFKDPAPRILATVGRTLLESDPAAELVAEFLLSIAGGVSGTIFESRVGNADEFPINLRHAAYFPTSNLSHLTNTFYASPRISFFVFY